MLGLPHLHRRKECILSFEVVAVAGYRIMRAVAVWLVLIAFDLVATLQCLAFDLVTAGTTLAIRAHLQRPFEGAVHVGGSLVLNGKDRYYTHHLDSDRNIGATIITYQILNMRVSLGRTTCKATLVAVHGSI